MDVIFLENETFFIKKRRNLISATQNKFRISIQSV
jgi:hypothetical protein